ncbi:MAG: SpoIID/LytB domain-containing protein [Ignavibacteriaceae bacterium]
MKYKLYYFFYIVFFLFVSCAPTVRTVSPNKNSPVLPRYSNVSPDTVRVLLSEELNSFSYKVETPVDLFADGNKVAHIKKGNLIDLKKTSSGLSCRVQKTTFSAGSFILQLSDGGTLPFNKKKYRGLFEFISSESSILLVNHVTMNDYLRGVLPYELPTKNDKSFYQALKAFTITARTFTITKMNRKEPFFDVLPDTRDQVYGGTDRENVMDSLAIAETEGMVLYYDNAPAHVMYHGSCGGFTESSKNIFTNDYPYLTSVEDGETPHCSISPTFGWQEVYSGSDISKFFFNTKFFMEEKVISDIEIISRFPSGRVSKLRISFKTGEEINLDHREIRQVFRNKTNNGILRSLLFNIQKDFKEDVLSKLIITGKGNGHGVGMCQWGALGLSKNGKDYKEILQHYFPSTSIQIRND